MGQYGRTNLALAGLLVEFWEPPSYLWYGWSYSRQILYTRRLR